MGRIISEAEKRTICENINMYIRQEYTDEEIADKVGITTRTICNWRKAGRIGAPSRAKKGKHIKTIEMKDLKYNASQFERMDGTPLPYKDEPETEIPFAGDDAFTDDCKDYCELEPAQDEKKVAPILRREVKISGSYIEVTEKNGAFRLELLGSVESDGKGSLMDALNQVIAECRGMMAELEG